MRLVSKLLATNLPHRGGTYVTRDVTIVTLITVRVDAQRCLVSVLSSCTPLSATRLSSPHTLITMADMDIDTPAETVAPVAKSKGKDDGKKRFEVKKVRTLTVVRGS